MLGLGLGIWLKSRRVVVALVVIGLAVSLVGWQADWFGDVDVGGHFTAGGGALVFWLIICGPLAVGAALGVFMMRSRTRAAASDRSPRQRRLGGRFGRQWQPPKLGSNLHPNLTGNRTYTRAHFLSYAVVVTPGTYR